MRRRIAAHLVEEGPGGWWRPVRIADVGPRGHVQERRAVAHRARHRMCGRRTAPPLARIRAHGVAGACGLEAEEPAARGGNADRSAAVARVRHGHHARRHRRCGATTRSARRVREAPGIPRRTEQARLGRRGETHLRRVGLPEDHEAAAFEPSGDLAVVIDHVILEERTAVAGHRPLVVRADVLEQVGHPGERAIGQPGVNGGSGLVV